MNQSLAPGERIDRYRIDKVLGRGGMAIVLRVVHEDLGSLHALKVLQLLYPGLAERLTQEGRMQASLKHPNVIAVTDIVRIGSLPGLVMEYVQGVSVGELVAVEPQSIAQAEALAMGIMDGVEAAHQRGLVHRDLKPDNVLLDISGADLVPKITDFGLARALDETTFGLGQHRTRSGQTLGTPAYMAPEQFTDSRAADQRSDIYALGAILYELLATKPAFAGTSLVAAYQDATKEKYPRLGTVCPRAPQRIQRAVETCLRADPDDRPQSVAELRALWLDGEPPPTRTGLWTPATMARLRRIRTAWEEAEVDQESLEIPIGPQTPAETTYPTPDAGTTQGTIIPADTTGWFRVGMLAGLLVALLVAMGITGSALIRGLSNDPEFPRERPGVDAPVPAVLLPADADSEASTDSGLGTTNALSSDADTQADAGSEADSDTSAEPDTEPEEDTEPRADTEAPVVTAPVPAPRPQPYPAVPASVVTTAPSPAPVRPAPPQPAPVQPAVIEPELTEPKPAPLPAPAPDTLVRLQGGVRGYLIASSGDRFPVGAAVPPGRYSLIVFFDGTTPTQAMTIQLERGESRTVTCSAQIGVCR